MASGSLILSYDNLPLLLDFLSVDSPQANNNGWLSVSTNIKLIPTACRTYQDHANTCGVVKNYGYGSRFVIDNSDLLPIDTLYEALQECNDWTPEKYEEYVTASRQALQEHVEAYASLQDPPPF